LSLAEIEHLQQERARRDAARCHYIEGVRNLIQAVEAGVEVETLVVSERLLRVPRALKLVRRWMRAGSPCLEVSPEQFRRISRDRRASGVGAVVRQHWTRLHRASPRAGLCWICLERARATGNVGSLLRTSEALGGAGVILLGREIDPFDPGVVRATNGSPSSW